MIREYIDETKFPLANTLSTITESDLVKIRNHHIPETHQLKAPLGSDLMYHRTDDWTTMPCTLLEKGVRLPLHAFIITLLGFIVIGFAQLVLNSYINIFAFIVVCHEIGVPSTIDFFFSLFSLGRSREPGFHYLSKQQRKPHQRIEK